MKVGICSIGSELVSGHVADTNAAWLAARVVESGCTVSAILVVGDDRARMLAALRWLADRSDVLVVGGGLGPTADDLTRYVVAELAGVELERRPDLVEHLAATYRRLERPMPEDALRQADVPVGSQVHAPKGTAAGFSLSVPRQGGTRVATHVLPGVPWEYRDLADRVVLPDLVRRSGGAATVTRTLHVAGLGESGVGQILRPLSDRLEAARAVPEHPLHGIELGFLATDDEVLVRVTATGPDPAAARRRTDPLVEEAALLLGAAVTSVDERRLEDEVASLLRRLGATVTTAETFTGGRIAASLTAPPTAASYLGGCFVAGSPAQLFALLGAEASDASSPPRVSAAVAGGLASASRNRSGADYAVAAIAVLDEEDADAEHPIGSAAWAVACPDGTVHAEERFIPAADRSVLQARGAAFALEALRRALLAALSTTHPAAPSTTHPAPVMP
jgi:nicotinamide-nucleotide amidase